MRRLTHGATAAVVVTALLTVAPDAHAAFAGSNGGIAFTRIAPGAADEPDRRSLWASATTRPRPHPLRICIGRSICLGSAAAWARGGQRIAFEYEPWQAFKPSVVAVLTPRVSVQQPISSELGPVTAPAWSPDGRWLAVSAPPLSDSGSLNVSGDTRRSIYAVRADGEVWRRLTHGPEDTAPAWSSRGVIAFERRGSSDDPDDVDVFAVRPNGSGLRRLTFRGGAAPDWSPDSRRVAFARVAGVQEDIYTVTAAGKGLQRVTRTGAATSPSWSPDGRQIAYELEGAIAFSGAWGGRATVVARPGREYSFADPAWRPSRRR